MKLMATRQGRGQEGADATRMEMSEERAVTGGQQAEDKEKHMKATTRSMTRSNAGDSRARTFSSSSSI
jgi:hypothetical protein